jgi:membrane protein YqaA with SNARE-associated domain
VTSKFSTVGLVAVAEIGNTLGSIVNWFLGRGIERSRDLRLGDDAARVIVRRVVIKPGSSTLALRS